MADRRSSPTTCSTPCSGAERAASPSSRSPDLVIPTGKRKGLNPSVASIYRALAEHARREVYPEAVEQAHADFAALQVGEVPGPAPLSLTAHHADHRELLVTSP
ncbi:hypothetical protein [Streptomyces sp. NPDC016172]|uniref:hypothetical protein n=1 Tax=Streptomyces sp. NPDC016172 TaxID=3364964 RepID=UPI0036F54F78